jgi:hypothetical protein
VPVRLVKCARDELEEADILPRDKKLSSPQEPDAVRTPH